MMTREQHECITAYEQGMSLSAVAAQYNISKHLVLKLLKKKDIRIRSTKEQRLLNYNAGKVIALYNSGLTISEIANKQGLSLANVRYCLQGVEKRSHSETLFEYRKRNPKPRTVPQKEKKQKVIDKERILNAYSNGLTAVEIEREEWCNVKAQTILKILKDHGVPITNKRKPVLVECADELYIKGYLIEEIAQITNSPVYMVRKSISRLRTSNHTRHIYAWKRTANIACFPDFDGNNILELSAKHRIPVTLLEKEFEFRGIKTTDWQQDLVDEYNSRISSETLAEKYSIHATTILRILASNGADTTIQVTSYPETLVKQILDKHDIEYSVHDRTVIKPKELDIYIPAHKLAIEINGLYWHSTDVPLTDTQHIDKFEMCRKQGIRLLQFTNRDIADKTALVESMILAKCGLLPDRIMARKCSIVPVPITAANELFEQWHYQGRTTNAAKVVGLEYSGNIVALLAYTTKGETLRIERYASKLNTNVIGGYSKLEKHVARSSQCKQAVTFSLGLISNGALYANSGYECVDGYASKPEWYVTDTVQLYNRQKFMKTKMPRLFGKGFDAAKTEWQNIVDNGLRLYFGAGITKWVKTL